MQQVAEENGLELSQAMPSSAFQAPASKAKETEHDELGERLAKLRG